MTVAVLLVIHRKSYLYFGRSRYTTKSLFKSLLPIYKMLGLTQKCPESLILP
jgi:hypothetical protein